MKKLFLFASFLLCVVGAPGQMNNKKLITFSGEVSGDTKGHNNIYYYSSGTAVDSVAIVNGRFNLTIPFTSPYTQLFYTQYEISGNRGYRPFPVLIDQPGNISIKMNIADGFFKADVSGFQTASLFHSFLKQQTDIYKKINDEIIRLHGKSWLPANDPGAEKINISRDSLMKLYVRNMVNDFVKQNPDAYVSVYVLGMSKTSMDINQLEETFRLLTPARQKSKEGETILAYIDGLKNAVIGKQVKNFKLNNEEGKPFSFDQLKGKYVWIDFWASWCGPCKKAFPNMREIYNKYKGNKFEIVGISADEKQEPWLKAVNEFKNPWLQVWDDKTVVAQFAVSAYPTSFLIDPEGKIILKEIGYDPDRKGEIEKKLEEIFGK